MARKLFKYNQKTRKMYEVKKMEPRGPSPHIIPDMPDYISPVTRMLVSGRTQRREDLKRTECREIDPSEKKDFMRDRRDDPVPFDFTRDDINQIEAQLGHRIGD